jgi:hypothetical protein
MEELKKINRVIEREYPEAYRETLVVLDATTGQNALSQAREFNEVAEITGVILTKMDGTAKGGIAVAIQAELGIPVKYIGVGEKIEDLQKFDADEFVNALFYKEGDGEEDEPDEDGRDEDEPGEDEKEDEWDDDADGGWDEEDADEWDDEFDELDVDDSEDWEEV